MLGWLVGFTGAFLIIELFLDNRDRKRGNYNYYDDCWDIPPANYEPPSKPPKQPLI